MHTFNLKLREYSLMIHLPFRNFHSKGKMNKMNSYTFAVFSTKAEHSYN